MNHNNHKTTTTIPVINSMGHTVVYRFLTKYE